MAFRNNIPDSSRTFHVSDVGNDANNGRSPEIPKQTLQAAINAAASQTPPPSASNPGFVNAEGSFTGVSILTMPQFVNFFGEKAQVFQDVPFPIVMDIASSTVVKLLRLDVILNAGINIDGESEIDVFVAQCDASGTGFQFSGLCNDISIGCTRLTQTGTASIGVDVTNTFTTTTDLIFNFEAVILDGSNGIFVRFNPINPTDKGVLSVSSVVKRGVAANTIGYEVLSGTLVVEQSGVLEADTVCHVADGATLHLDCSELVGDIIIDANGTLIARIDTHIGTLTNNGTIEGFIGTTTFGDQTFVDTVTIEKRLSIAQPTAGQDAELLFSVPTQNWLMGIDDSDGDKLKITTSLALASNARFVLDTAGRLSLGDVGGDPSALLHLNTTNFGFLMPRMTTTQRDAISSPATGLEIFNTTTGQPEFFNGTVWISATSAQTLAQTLLNGNTTGATDLLVSTGGNLRLVDNAVLTLGDSNDLVIFHDGATSRLTNNTGLFAITNGTGGDLLLQSTSIANRVAVKLGSATDTVSFAVRNSADTPLLSVFGAGGTVIGGATVLASALLQLDSTTRGFLMPRLTTVQRDAIASPATGLEIYNITTLQPQFFDGTSWTATAGAETLAQTLANGNVTDGTDIIVSVGDSILTPDGVVGGNLPITLGSGSAGDGGDFDVFAGDAGGITDFAGGRVSIRAGNGIVGGSGGNVVLGSGSGGLTGGGGSLTFNAGGGGTNAGNGGAFFLSAGSGGASSSGTGGAITITSGFGGVTGAGGAVNITAGNGGATSGAGGAIAVQAGATFGGVFSDVILQVLGGNVGIGIPSPSTRLHVQIPATNAVADGITIQHLGSSASAAPVLRFTNSFGQSYALGIDADEDDFKLAPGTDLVNLIKLTMNTAGHIALGTSGATPQAILTLASTTSGFLLPRMSTTQRDAIPGATVGNHIYNLTTNQLEHFNGSAWVASSGGGSETLAQTLALGNVTGGNPIVISSGDSIISPDGTVGVDLDLFSGSGSAGSGGALGINSGGGTTIGGEVSLRPGAGLAPNGIGGDILLLAGDGVGTGSGGRVSISGGLNASLVRRDVVIQSSSGSVGIGTPSPDRVLHVRGDAMLIERAVNAPGVILRNTLDGTIEASMLLVNDGFLTGYTTFTNLSAAHILNIKGDSVGIGTIAPKSRLHVLTSGTSGLGAIPVGRGIALSGTTANCRVYLEATDATAGQRAWLLQNVGPTLSFNSVTDTAGAETRPNVIAMDHASGHVSFGTAPDPALAFLINGSGATESMRLQTSGALTQVQMSALDAGTSFVGTITNDDFGLVTNNAVRMTVDAAGNVGIGTDPTAVEARLNVAGGEILIERTSNSPGVVMRNTLNGSITGAIRLQSTGPSAGYLELTDNVGTALLFLRGGRIGIGTTNPDLSALLHIDSTIDGFLPPRMTTAQRDAVAFPAAGLEVYNNETNVPQFFDGTNWAPLVATAFNTVHVRSLADLPAPVANVITIPADTTLYIDGLIDLGTNKLAPLGNINLFGNGNFNSSLTSSHVDGIIDLGTNVGTVNPTNLVLTSTAPSPITIRINNAGSSLIAERVNVFGDWVIGDFQFVNMERVTHFNTIRFTTTSPFGTYTASISAFIPGAGIDSIVIDPGVTIAEINITFDVLFITATGAAGIVVEDPASVDRGFLDELEFLGTGSFLACRPVSSSNFNFVAGSNPEGVAFDDDGNLIIADRVANTITRMVGITNVVDVSIAAPGPSLGIRGVVWARGNLISLNTLDDTIRQHVGFTTAITNSFGTPGTQGLMLAYDGTNLLSTDNLSGFVTVHAGITATQIKQFTTAAGELRGIAFDGINILVTDITANQVLVLEGQSGTLQYVFDVPAAAAEFRDIVVTDTGFIASDLIDDIFLYDHSVTFDHSSPTWEVLGGGGAYIESSDRGGSQAAQPGIAVPVVLNVFTDIEGAGMVYRPFTTMEKCRLNIGAGGGANGDVNGEILWTGVKKIGHVLTGLVTMTRDGAAGDKFYNLAILINGELQDDSIIQGVLPSNNAFITMQTMPITRDLTEGDLVKVQIAPVIDPSVEDPIISFSKVAIN